MRLLFRLGMFLTALSLCTGGLRAAGPAVGDTPPEITLDEWISAKPDTSGKTILLEFWATWCGPCRKSIPHLNEIYEKYKDSDLVIIGVSQETKDVVTAFQQGTPMNYANGISKNLAQQYGVTGIPHAFLIGKDGKVFWEGHPMQLTKTIIDNALR